MRLTQSPNPKRSVRNPESKAFEEHPFQISDFSFHSPQHQYFRRLRCRHIIIALQGLSISKAKAGTTGVVMQYLETYIHAQRPNLNQGGWLLFDPAVPTRIYSS
jgi:hypothetical protein